MVTIIQKRGKTIVKNAGDRGVRDSFAEPVGIV
jgi:hypothetical protein